MIILFWKKDMREEKREEPYSKCCYFKKGVLFMKKLVNIVFFIILFSIFTDPVFKAEAATKRWNDEHTSSFLVPFVGFGYITYYISGEEDYSISGGQTRSNFHQVFIYQKSSSPTIKLDVAFANRYYNSSGNQIGAIDFPNFKPALYRGHVFVPTGFSSRYGGNQQIITSTSRQKGSSLITVLGYKDGGLVPIKTVTHNFNIN